MKQEINRIAQQCVDLYHPEKIVLFGSQAKNTATDDSDIDLCVIVETKNKRRLLTEMYATLDCERPFDLVLYTPEEWANSLTDSCSFAHVIHQEGVVLYVR